MSASLKRMSDRGAKNGEDMLEVLVDDLDRYERLSAIETEEVLLEVEGHHYDIPIPLENLVRIRTVTVIRLSRIDF